MKNKYELRHDLQNGNGHKNGERRKFRRKCESRKSVKERKTDCENINAEERK